jgi:hypothetical protein
MESRRAAILGLAAVLFLWAWQFLTVHYNYGGNWTALFCIRPGMPVPPFLKNENLYIFEGTQGYDGQVYHLIAHDPWMRKGSADAIVGVAFRYQRIFVPALAWTIALGQDRWIHPAYFSVILGFAFLGVYWLALFAVRMGMQPAWGLGFVITPATITSIDRMTIDIALAALTVGFALYAEGKTPRWKVIAVLTCAALTRESAIPIIGAYAIYLFTKRRFVDCVWAGATALPALAWYIYLAQRDRSSLASYFDWVPFAGLVERLIHPVIYSLSPFKNAAGIVFDYIALAGVVIALALAMRMAIQRQWSPLAASVYALALAAMIARSRSIWEDAYAFGRPFTPLMLLVAMQYLARWRWLALVPMLMVDSRISLNFFSQIVGVVRGLGLLK